VDAVQDILPDSIIDRPKMGFELPLAEWLTGPLKSRAHTALGSRYAEALFTPGFREQTKERLDSQSLRGNRRWGYGMLLEWMRFHNAVV
jgi:asparagine synthase (glutamine-hydrolysing)